MFVRIQLICRSAECLLVNFVSIWFVLFIITIDSMRVVDVSTRPDESVGRENWEGPQSSVTVDMARWRSDPSYEQNQ